MSVRLSELMPCFQGVTPSSVATCDSNGVPNIAYLSQVDHIDDRHVALSCQFFNKTKHNVLQNPYACIKLLHPATLLAYKMHVKYIREEKSGPLFERMDLRIEAIASQTGMKGIFKLLSADVYEVLDIEEVPGHLLPSKGTEPAWVADLSERRHELAGLQVLSDRMCRAQTLEQLIGTTLESMCELLGVQHAMLLMHDEQFSRLFTVESRGYQTSGAGAEVPLGDGLIGTVAKSRRVLRVSGMRNTLRYSRAARAGAQQSGADVCDEIPLPGLADAQAQLALPLVAHDRLVGVLMFESRDPLAFESWHEAYLSVLANQAALAIAMLAERDDDSTDEAAPPETPPLPARRRVFTWFAGDESVFVDGEYLIRNVPARILWKLLNEHAQGRREFTNRELRMDESLGLPPVKDNLESRLILLRKRLAERCPDVRLVPVRRGRFMLERDSEIVLEAKP